MHRGAGGGIGQTGSTFEIDTDAWSQDVERRSGNLFVVGDRRIDQRLQTS